MGTGKFTKKIYRFTGILILFLFIGCAREQVPREIIFYPPEPNEPKIQFLRTILSERELDPDVGIDGMDFLLGPERTIGISLAYPYEVASEPGKIYVSDRQYKTVFTIDLENKKITPFGGMKGLDISGIWVTPDLYKFMVSIRANEILAFGPENKFIRKYGDAKTLPMPTDVAVKDDNIYVVDMKRAQVVVFDRSSGEEIMAMSQPGGKQGYLNRPSHISINGDGNIFVTDAFNFRISEFTPEGVFVKTIGTHGDFPGQFARPKGLVIDNENRIWIVDAASQVAQIFNYEGKMLTFFGGAGQRGGSMGLPAGINIDYDNIDFFRQDIDPGFEVEFLIYVVNMKHPYYKLNVYGFGHKK